MLRKVKKGMRSNASVSESSIGSPWLSTALSNRPDNPIHARILPPHSARAAGRPDCEVGDTGTPTTPRPGGPAALHPPEHKENTCPTPDDHPNLRTMNPVPARLLRPLAESCKSRPPPPARDHKRRDYLIEAARNMFIQYGRSGITMSQFALATGITQLAIKQQIGDLHHLFGLVPDQASRQHPGCGILRR